MDVSYEGFVEAHEPSLIQSAVPKRYWKTLWEKVMAQSFDAGDAFGLIEVNDESKGLPKDRPYRVVTRNAVDVSDPRCIWLVDHCWTWHDRAEASAQLKAHEGLAERMAALMHLDTADESAILDEMWRWCQTYKLTVNNVAQSLWYVLDEFGCQLRHHGDANFVLIPFYCQNFGYSISVLFPRRSAVQCMEVTRDYCYGVTDTDARRVQMMPWVKSKLSAPTVTCEKPRQFFEQIAEQLEMGTVMDPAMIPFISPPPANIQVYTDTDHVRESLSDSLFDLVANRDEADILWLNGPVLDFSKQFDSGPAQLVNSIPFQYLLTVKIDLAQLARRTVLRTGAHAHWLPATYDILTELESLCVEFNRREAAGLDNVWMLKGQNEPKLTKDLNEIVRYRETQSPLLIQKFISNQMTLGGRAFSFRYYFMIKSIEPIEAFVIDTFQGQFCQAEFNVDILHERSGLLTNSVGPDECTFFQDTLLEHAPDSLVEIRNKSVTIIRQVILAAISKEHKPPAAMSHYPQSRGFFAADFVLERNDDSSPSPKLFGIESNPSTQSLTSVDSQFVNKLFKTLFCDDMTQLPLIDLNS